MTFDNSNLKKLIWQVFFNYEKREEVELWSYVLHKCYTDHETVKLLAQWKLWPPAFSTKAKFEDNAVQTPATKKRNHNNMDKNK